jgi:hypothetical protein
MDDITLRYLTTVQRDTRGFRGLFGLPDFLANIELIMPSPTAASTSSQPRYCIIHINGGSVSKLGHFVVLLTLGDKCYFIDSFGKEPILYSQGLFEFVHSYPNIYKIPYQIQGYSSKLCGIFSCYFIRNFTPICNRVSLSDFTRKYFTTNTSVNERNLLFWFKSKFHITSSDDRICFTNKLSADRHCTNLSDFLDSVPRHPSLD